MCKAVSAALTGRRKNFWNPAVRCSFSGTPCQIRGLKLFLAKEYENLLTVDLVCHGVPSPEIWRQYLHETIARKGFKHTNSELRSTSQITGINFRDKTTGWQHFSLRFILRRETGAGLPETADVSRIHYKDPFFYCFLSHVTERYSCYACPAKELKSGSDITLGDFWGFRGTKDFPDDNNGISLLLNQYGSRQQIYYRHITFGAIL